MADNKKQHFVPRFYLKSFSVEGKIHSYLVEKDLEIRETPYKSHCYEDYFYGKNLTLEKSLGRIESVVGPVLESILTSKKLPEKSSEDYFHLLLYAATQSLRTKTSLHNSSNLVDSAVYDLLDEMLHRNGIEADAKDILSLNIDPEFLVQRLMKKSFQSVPLLFDLKALLIQNDTDTTFITSDHPTILSNPFFGINLGLPAVGFQSRGLILYLPLSPKFCLMLFDASYYVTGNSENSITVLDTPTVEALNSFQILNCFSNIFYSGPIGAQEIRKWAAEVMDRRGDIRSKIFKGKDERVGEKEVRQLIGHVVLSPQFFPSISFLRIKRPEEMTKEELYGGVRNPLLCEAHRRFCGILKERNLSEAELGLFMIYFEQFL